MKKLLLILSIVLVSAVTIVKLINININSVESAQAQHEAHKQDDIDIAYQYQKGENEAMYVVTGKHSSGKAIARPYHAENGTAPITLTNDYPMSTCVFVTWNEEDTEFIIVSEETIEGDDARWH